MNLLNDLWKIQKGFGFVNAANIVLIPKLLRNRALKHRAILNYLATKYSDIIDTYKLRPKSSENISPNCPIWICWLQGEEQMPPVVRGCFASVKRHAMQHPICLITLKNYKEHVSIPDYIIDKLKKGEISYTLFSDILRNTLLADKGGIWLDATIYLTQDWNDLDLPFYTIKQNRPDDHVFVSGYRWTGFCMASGTNSLLNSFVRDLFNAYFQEEKGMIDYFLIDYIIALGYNYVPEIKKLIDAVPFSCPNLYYMQQHMAQPVNEADLERVYLDTFAFKLNWHLQAPADKSSLYYRLRFDKNA